MPDRSNQWGRPSGSGTRKRITAAPTRPRAVAVRQEAPRLIAAAIVLLGLYLYRRPWGLPLWLRVFLALARVLVLALVVVGLAGPYVESRLDLIEDVASDVASAAPRVEA